MFGKNKAEIVACLKSLHFLNLKKYSQAIILYVLLSQFLVRNIRLSFST